MEKLAPALIKAQNSLKTALKDATNPFYQSAYADLGSIWDACRGALKDNKIAVLQPLSNINGTPAMATIIVHESGEFLETVFPLNPPKDDPQAMGSYITYMRRYGLASAIGIITGDDDGEAAMQREPKKKAAPEKKAEDATRKLLGEDLCFILNLDIKKLSATDKGKIKLKLQKVAEYHDFEGVNSVAKLSGTQLEAIANTIAEEAAQTHEALNEDI